MISQQRFLPFGGVRTDVQTPNSPATDYGYTGQRDLDEGIGGLMDYKARFYSPYITRWTQPDTIVPNPVNPQAWDRYCYVLNNPIRNNDPTGHMRIDGGVGAKGSPKENLLIAIQSRFSNVKIKNPNDWSADELHVLNDNLARTLDVFGGNSKTFENIFGDMTFEVVPDGSLEFAAQAYPQNGLIQLTHGSFDPSGWVVAHEMGHIFDMRWSGGDPKSYYSQLFVDLLNGGCEHPGPHGCLGYGPVVTDYFIEDQPWYYFGDGYGEYFPPNNLTTSYGLSASTEDFAESYAGVITGDPQSQIGGSRELIVNIIINLIVSYYSQ